MGEALIGPIGTLFLFAVLVNIFLSWLARDWRLQVCSVLFFVLWGASKVVSFIEPVSSAISLIVLTRIQIRRKHEAKLAWWIVPIIVAELGIFLTQPAFFVFPYRTYYYLVTALFSVQLLVVFFVSIKKIAILTKRAIQSEPNTARSLILQN